MAYGPSGAESEGNACLFIPIGRRFCHQPKSPLALVDSATRASLNRLRQTYRSAKQQHNMDQCQARFYDFRHCLSWRQGGQKGSRVCEVRFGQSGGYRE